MGTALTGTTPQDTYDSLIKVTDNGPLSGTLKRLTDGLGNDSSLSLSTAAARITGNLTVKSTTERANITTDVDLVTENGIGILSTSTSYGQGYQYVRFFNSSAAYAGSISQISATGIGLYSGASADLVLGANSTERMRITSAGDAEFGDGNNFNPVIQYAGSGRVAASPAYSFRGDLDTGMFNPNTSNNIAFATAATERFRITDNGVTFNGDTAAANALDDYEEGTWTMGIAFGGASTGITYFLNSGTYTKIGRQVTVNGILSLTSKGSATGDATLTGLPFTIGTGFTYYSAPATTASTITSTGSIQGRGGSASTFINLEQHDPASGANAALTDANFANNSDITISFTYFV